MTLTPPGTSTVRKPTSASVSAKATPAVNPASFSNCSGSILERTRAAWEATAMMSYTFSISGLPRSPVGRKISTSTRIEYAATSLYSTVK